MSVTVPKVPILPPEIIDEILIYIGRADLAYSLDILSIMKHFLPEEFEEGIRYAYYAILYSNEEIPAFWPSSIS
jgi:hypothetical protein